MIPATFASREVLLSLQIALRPVERSSVLRGGVL